MVIERTREYDRWFSRLRDLDAKFRIARYFEKLQGGSSLQGDFKGVGGGVVEVRFHFGPGYRVYLAQNGSQVVLLLIGGDKSTQKADIRKAQKMAEEWRRNA